MPNSISRELAKAAQLCGVEDFDAARLFGFWLDACAMQSADLQFSESFRNLVRAPVEIDERDQALSSLASFGLEVGVDYRERAGGADARWRTLEVVAPERVSDAEALGKKVCSFYAQPRRVLLSFDPEGYEFQLWHVPTSSQLGDATAAELEHPVASLPEAYRPHRELYAAFFYLPHCGHDAETYRRHSEAINAGLAVWNGKFTRYAERPLPREGSRRAGFKAASRGGAAGRGRAGGFRRY